MTSRLQLHPLSREVLYNKKISMTLWATSEISLRLVPHLNKISFLVASQDSSQFSTWPSVGSWNTKILWSVTWLVQERPLVSACPWSKCSVTNVSSVVVNLSPWFWPLLVNLLFKSLRSSSSLSLTLASTTYSLSMVVSTFMAKLKNWDAVLTSS